MSPANLLGTVQDSKAKRQERLKSRFRDRGGIFVPSEGNDLANILLARGVNGESPIRKRASRKSAGGPKSRATAPSKAATKTKTPRTGASKRGTRKSVATPHRNEGKENALPGTKASRGKSKTPKLQETKTSDGATAQRMPFADQLAAAINSTKTPTTFPTSEKSRPATAPMSDVPSLLGKGGKTVEKRKGKAAAVDLPLRYSEGLGAANEMTTSPAKTIMSPLVLALESQRKVAQEKTGTTAAPRNERSNNSGTRPPLGAAKAVMRATREPEDSDSDDSDVPLAKICAKRADMQAKSREDEAQPQKKGRSAKANAGDDGSKKKRTRARVDPSSSAGKVRVSQEKNAPAKAPRKRTKVTMDDSKGEKEHEDEPPKKKRRRAADPAVGRRRRKEDEEIPRSAREASVVTMDRPMPSPVKQPQPEPAARRKPASKAKPRSRTASAARGRRPRGLPPSVLRRIKINAQTLPALGDVDDDDPIDFLRS